MTKDRLCDLKAAQNDEDEFELLEAQINMEVADGFMEEFFVEVITHFSLVLVSKLRIEKM